MLRQNIKPYLLLLLVTIFFYLPIFVIPDLLLARENDLQEQFWPVFYFIKQQFLTHHSLPLWNNLFFSGTPLLSDPQFPLFYPPYTAFLLLPTDTAFLVSIVLHTLFGGIGAYLVARRVLGLSEFASTFTGVLFLFMPRLSGYLEAGHFGLVATLAWLPWIIFAVFKIIENPKFSWSILLAISLAGLFYTHTVTFVLAASAAIILFGTLLLVNKRKSKMLKRIVYFLTGLSVTFGLSAITLLPQLNWIPQTTRFLLLQDRDVYPKWTSLNEFLQAILVPWIYQGGLGSIDTEKWLTFGFTPLLLALFGFFFLKRKVQVGIVLGALIVVLISLNNLSPLYSLLLSLDWYVLARVATRIWFIPTLLVIFLAGFGLEKLANKKRLRGFIVLFVILAIGESLLLSWARILKPVPRQDNFAPRQVYEYLSKDKDRFRVFCTTRCLSQKQAAINNLQLVEGYNTLQQTNYFEHSWGLMGGYWNYYTLAVPPVGAYKFGELQPNSTSLGEYNTKYIVSPHELKDRNFILEEKFSEYLVYRNSKFLPRAYFWTEDQKPGPDANIMSYSPNKIRVDTSLEATSRLVLAEVWSPGWKAYLDSKTQATVQEIPNSLRLVDLKPGTQFVDFVYEPENFLVGRVITITTTILIIAILIAQHTTLLRRSVV